MRETDRVRSLEFNSLRREHYIAFARYGSVRTRTELQADVGIAQEQRTGPWRAEQIFDAWLAFQRGKLGNETGEVEGWIPPNNDTQSADNTVEVGSAERARLLSEDGITDPRNEWTELDAQFIILFELSSLPTAYQAMAEPNGPRPTTTSLAEGRMKLNQETIDQLDGRVPLPVSL